ncbi:MAG TPA: hypothetical protein VF713_21335 [Thermoanaerobaculia bacterium]
MQKIRKAVLAFSFATLFILAGTAANASCPTITPYSCCGLPFWYGFAVDSSCLDSYGVSPVYSVSWCYPMYWAGYTYGTGYTLWTFTVPANSDNYVRQPSWSVSTPVTFSSPTSSVFDNIQGYVMVMHNGSTTVYNWFSLDGNTSSSQYCSTQNGSFSATTGDTITLYIQNSRWDSNAVMEAGTPVVVNY